MVLREESEYSYGGFAYDCKHFDSFKLEMRYST